jgi:type I restriction enzyme S subunit
VSIEHLITEHLDIWTAADTEKKSGRGRGSANSGNVYGIKKLRELILELAVRGKLVPQDPNDEPASELLKRIQSEKAKLVDEGKIKKEKPLASITEEEKPFELPVGWEWVRLAAIGFSSTGRTPSTQNSSLYNGPIPFIGPGQITLACELLPTDKWISEAGRKETTIAKTGDILMVCIGGSIGKSAIADKEMGFNQQINCISPLYIESKFAHISMMANSFQSKLLQFATGSATPIINKSKWEELLVPVPPLIEQHRIVAKVDELMALCDQLENQHNNAAEAHEKLVAYLLGTLTQSQNAEDFNANWQRIAEHFDTLFTTETSIDELKQTLLQLAVMGKLVQQDPNDEPASELLKRILQERDRQIEYDGSRTKANDETQQSEMYIVVPDCWIYCRLGNLARFIDYRGKTPKKISSGVSLITAKNVRFGYISREPEEYVSPAEYESWMTRGFPRGGDMLFTTEAPLGNIAIIDIAEKFALAQRVICFRLHDQTIGAYLKIAIMSNQVQQQLINAATGMTATGIKASKLKEIPVPIPPLEEQHRIVAKVDELMAICDQLKTRITEANELQRKIADVVVENAI